jgi:hypothetical protein
VEDSTKDLQLHIYVAECIFHYGLVTGAWNAACSFWPMVARAIDFALALQAPTGEIYWARNKEGVADPMALLTGSSSIFMRFNCALSMAERQGLMRPEWEESLKRRAMHPVQSESNQHDQVTLSP